MNYYIHIPFCRKKCGYCAFYSEENAPAELIGRYLTALEKELREFPVSGSADTVFIGGGTPTLPDVSFLTKLLTAVTEYLYCTGDTEITIEANPETLDREKIKILADFVNRISVGVQREDLKSGATECYGVEFYKKSSIDALQMLFFINGDKTSIDECVADMAEYINFE